MRRTFIAAAAALVVASPSLSQNAGFSWPDREIPRLDGVEPNEGRWVAIGGFYGHASMPCVQCHGILGAGNSSGAFPRLTDQVAEYLYKSLVDYATGLRPSPVMTPIARALTEQEMRDVAAHYASVENAPYPAEPNVDAQTLQVGRAIAEQGIPGQGVPSCVSCHGPGGIGNAPLYPYLAGQFAPYLEYQLILWKRGLRDGDPQNVMELIAKAMTEMQIRSVSIYFASLRPPEVTPGEGGPVVAGVWNLPEATEPRPSREPPPTVFRGNPTDVGAVGEVGERRNSVVVPEVEPPMRPPDIDLPTGLPRRPLPHSLWWWMSPPTRGEGLDTTTTTTGERPVDRR